jgi:hypothetical protein
MDSRIKYYTCINCSGKRSRHPPGAGPLGEAELTLLKKTTPHAICYRGGVASAVFQLFFRISSMGLATVCIRPARDQCCSVATSGLAKAPDCLTRVPNNMDDCLLTLHSTVMPTALSMAKLSIDSGEDIADQNEG